MVIPTTPFDAAQYLRDAESQLALLNEALDTKSAPVVVHAIRTIVCARDIAEPTTKLDIDPALLSEVVADGSDPTIAAILAVLYGLDFELQARMKTKAT